MYKLLLATDQAAVLQMFDELDAWDELGFRKPRVVASAEAAIASLKAHRADAVCLAIAEPEKNALMDWLTVNKPILPVLDVPEDRAQLMSGLLELRSLLNRMHADYSNDGTTAADMLQLCRHDFFRTLLAGSIDSELYVRRHLHLLRSRMDPDKPCVVAALELAEDDDFMTTRWHYGNERMETALRNFFGAELDGMRILISVLEDHRVFLLCCPMVGAEVLADSITAEVIEHAEESIIHVREYLGADFHIGEIRVLPALTALAQNG